MTKLINKDWINTKKKFKTGLVLSIIIVFSFLVWDGFKGKNIENKLISEVKILSKNPTFEEESHGKSGTNYYIELQFVNDNEKYKIDGVDYYFLKDKDFVNDIKSGDTISISKYENSIHYLSKNGKQYLDYKRAITNRINTITFLGLLFIPMIFICVIALFLKNQPTIQIRNKIYKVELDIIVIVTFIITFIILALNIPFTFIINGEFVK